MRRRSTVSVTALAAVAAVSALLLVSSASGAVRNRSLDEYPTHWLAGAAETTQCTTPGGRGRCNFTYISAISNAERASVKRGEVGNLHVNAVPTDPLSGANTIEFSSLSQTTSREWWAKGNGALLPGYAPLGAIEQLTHEAGVQYPNNPSNPHDDEYRAAPPTTELAILTGGLDVQIPTNEMTPDVATRCKRFENWRSTPNTPRLYGAGFGGSRVVQSEGGKLRILAISDPGAVMYRVYDGTMQATPVTFPANQGFGYLEVDVRPGEVSAGIYGLGVAAETKPIHSSLPFPCMTSIPTDQLTKSKALQVAKPSITRIALSLKRGLTPTKRLRAGGSPAAERTRKAVIAALTGTTKVKR